MASVVAVVVLIVIPVVAIVPKVVPVVALIVPVVPKVVAVVPVVPAIALVALVALVVPVIPVVPVVGRLVHDLLVLHGRTVEAAVVPGDGNAGTREAGGAHDRRQQPGSLRVPDSHGFAFRGFGCCTAQRRMTTRVGVAGEASLKAV